MADGPTIMTRIGASWRGAFRDVVLIVVSILIAFSLETWWSGRQEHQRTSLHFAALSHEFQESLAGLRNDQAKIERAIRATRAILAVMGTEQPESFADTLASWLNASYDVAVTAPQGGALSALLSSGDIRLIRDDSLAYSLALWPVSLEHLKADNAILTASREQELRGRLIALGVPESKIAANLLGLDLPPTRFDFDANVVLGDAGVESMLVSRLIRLRILNSGVQSTATRAEQIIARITRHR